MTRADLMRRIDAVLVLDEGRFEASREIISDVLRECRDALTVDTCDTVHVVKTAAVGKSEAPLKATGCTRMHCRVCNTGMYGE